MNEKYDEAALRHFTDAEALARMERFDNAGHLIGFAAECAIKFAVYEPNRAPHKHLPNIAEAALEARRQISGRRSTRIFNLLENHRLRFFEDWTVTHRYWPDGTVTREMFEKWSDLAEQVLEAAKVRSTA